MLRYKQNNKIKYLDQIVNVNNMESLMTKTTTLLIPVLVVSAYVCFFYHQDRGGIIALPNYEHAVVICGDETGNEQEDIKDVAHMRLWNGNTYTINWGHANDPEIAVLKDVADERCAHYKAR